MLQRQKFDVLRGIAILLVFSYHLALVVFGNFEINDLDPTWLWTASQRYPLKRMLLNLTPAGIGAQGVNLFLLVSGFLLHFGFLRAGAAFGWREFFSKRFWRIYPPYVVVLAAFCGWHGSWQAQDVVMHLTFTHNLSGPTIFSINPSFWSLALEVQLYLLYPVFLWLRLRWGIRPTVLAIGGLAVAAILVGVLLAIQAPVYWLAVPQRWVVWAMGAYLGEQYFRRRQLFTGHPAWLLLGLALLVASRITVVYLMLGNLLFSWWALYALDWYLHQPPRPANSGWNQVARSVEHWLAFLGQCSYSFYLLHQPLLIALVPWLSRGRSGWLITVGVSSVAFLGLLGLSWLGYRLLELPAIQWGQRRRLFRPPA